ncbi:hypothetical protein B0H11DRAFT_203694 [Mycena galericulata]|nr:hypothetical protein B0H11DRAFT_203694 [Mycena galericulata]
MKSSAAEVEAPPANAIHLRTGSPANLELQDTELTGTTLDPIGRLPFEISSEIFVQCIPSRPKPGAHHFPMVLLNICRAWTVIALSTPQLWDSIDVVFPRWSRPLVAGRPQGQRAPEQWMWRDLHTRLTNLQEAAAKHGQAGVVGAARPPPQRPNGFARLLEAWLQRARNQPLSISFHGSIREDIGSIVLRHTQQLRNLEIYLDGEDVEVWSQLAPFPFLETLKIGATSDPNLYWDDRQYSALHILTILRLAPNLVECTLENIFPMFFLNSHNSADIIILPSLRRLNLGSISDSPIHDEILQNLTLPALQTLVLRVFETSLNDLITFLKRSSPPLLALTIGDTSDPDFVPFLNDFPRLLPTLECLELYPPTDVVQALFARLSASPSHFLPNLRSLRIYASNSSFLISKSTWTNVLHILSIRRSHITDFKLTSRGRLLLPPATVVAGLRELAADGMEIYIGTRERNHIPSLFASSLG